MLLVERDGLVYEVKSQPKDLCSDKIGLCYNLELLCGYDYIDMDYSDIQGYVSPNMFSNDAQLEYLVVYFDESVKERLEEEGFTIRKTLPKIHVKSFED